VHALHSNIMDGVLTHHYLPTFFRAYAKKKKKNNDHANRVNFSIVHKKNCECFIPIRIVHFSMVHKKLHFVDFFFTCFLSFCSRDEKTLVIGEIVYVLVLFNLPWNFP
jgi:hypothetical protein